MVELRGFEPQHLPVEMAPELRSFDLRVVAPCAIFLGICVGVLRDVTVLAAPGRNRWVMSYVPGVLLHARRFTRTGQPVSGVLPVSPREWPTLLYEMRPGAGRVMVLQCWVSRSHRRSQTQCQGEPRIALSGGRTMSNDLGGYE